METDPHGDQWVARLREEHAKPGHRHPGDRSEAEMAVEAGNTAKAEEDEDAAWDAAVAAIPTADARAKVRDVLDDWLENDAINADTDAMYGAMLAVVERGWRAVDGFDAAYQALESTYGEDSEFWPDAAVEVMDIMLAAIDPEPGQEVASA